MSRTSALRGCLAIALLFTDASWVRSDTPTVDTQSTSSGSTVDNRTVQNLPVNGRNFSDLMKLAPGVAEHKITPQDAFNWSSVPFDQSKVPSLQQPFTDFKNIAPRTGLNWDPFKDGRSKIHGDYGVFFDRAFLHSSPGLSTLNQLAGQREWPAAASGNNGLVIATGKSRGKEKTAVIYGSDGRPIASFTAHDVKKNPDLALGPLNYGCQLSRLSSGKQQLMMEDYITSNKERLMMEDYLTSNKQRLLREDRLKGTIGSGGVVTPASDTTGGTTSNSPSILDDLKGTLPSHPNPTGEPTIEDHKDGSSTRTWPDGTKEITRPDGSQDVTYPDGSKFTRQPDGMTVESKPDGSSVTKDKDGKTTATTPPTTPTTPQGPSTTTPGKGTVTDQDILKGAQKLGKSKMDQKSKDYLKSFLNPQGQPAGGTSNGTPSGSTPQPTPSTPQGQTPSGGTSSTTPGTTIPTSPTNGTPSTTPAPTGKNTVTDQDILKGMQKLDKNKNMDQKSKDYLKSFLNPQGQPGGGTSNGTSGGSPDANSSQLPPTSNAVGTFNETRTDELSRPKRIHQDVFAPAGSPPGLNSSQSSQAAHVHDFGEDLGGPIVKDRLWFWGSYGTLDKIDSSIPGYRRGIAPPYFESGVRIGDTIYSNLGTRRVGEPFSQLPGAPPPFSLPQGWTPSNVMILQSGCAASDKPARLNDINMLWDGKRPLIGSGVYFIEPVFFRTVQGKHAETSASVPNDPLYDKGAEARQRITNKAKSSERRGGPDLSAAAPPGSGLSTEISPGGEGKKGVPAIDQWGLRAVGFTSQSQTSSAWNAVDASKPNTIVAVIDSGLDLTHPDGPEFLWTNPGETPGNGIDDDHDGYVDDIHGWNFADENNDLTDLKGHGTLVAGIIAAKRNNGIGIAGINPGAQIMVLKVTDQYGKTNSVNIYRAIHYAVEHGARVINISLGDAGVSQLEQLAVNYAHAHGAVIIVAAGNQSGDVAQYGPPALRRVLPIGMLKMDGTMSGLSNRGVNVALAAPGEQIYSLHSKDAEWEGSSMIKDRQYFAATGTSFSAPIVAATASLILAKNPALPNTLVEDILLDSATSMSPSGWEPSSGWGVLNATDALTFDANNLLTVRPTELVVTHDAQGVPSVDVFGIIRGRVAQYQISIGKGKQPTEWQPVGPPIAEPIEYGLLCHFDGDGLSRSHDWVVRIVATGAEGRTKTVDVPVSL